MQEVDSAASYEKLGMPALYIYKFSVSDYLRISKDFHLSHTAPIIIAVANLLTHMANHKTTSHLNCGIKIKELAYLRC